MQPDGVFLSDCPANGCIGLAFTIPAGFTADKGYTASCRRHPGERVPADCSVECRIEIGGCAVRAAERNAPLTNQSVDPSTLQSLVVVVEF